MGVQESFEKEQRTAGAKTPGAVAAIFFSIALLILSVDQLTKFLAIYTLPRLTTVKLIGEVVQLRLTENSGGAFSLGAGFTPLLTFFSAAVALTLIIRSRKIPTYGWAVLLGLLLGGALGNLVDRFFRAPGFPNGQVIDFFYTPWLLPAIYNVADIAISSSLVLIIVRLLFDTRGAKKADDSKGEAASATASFPESPSPEGQA